MLNHHSQKPKLIIILGPTAIGKTDWVFKLCKKFNGAIVSADSRQIYQEMNIGTGKSADKNNIHQYMIDVVSPDETLTLSEYKNMALECIYNIISQGKIPFLIGGTGLYISAIVDNLEIPEVKPDWELRKQLESKDITGLQLELKSLDPIAYQEIDLNNKRRLIRAIEVSKTTGNPFSSLRKKGEPLFECLQIGIDIQKEELHKRIDKRVDQMRKDGLQKEVKKLSEKYSWGLPSMSGIGYKEFKEKSSSDENEIFEEIKKHTRQYAKRQMTWFRKDKKIIWCENYEKAENKIAFW